ncbi:vitamin K epoxide reductase family protein [Serinibacter salmoneus]|uniref:Putative membrane protein n=1 Tax=Serinibacter salmoneus TaxID=556530 RepID=A0A2A9CZB6_9MICO|nr:vitamin K epoxide reductase family protein [Serinibacter salmoneus]PFG19788.1 putative membrane protein [Serinibacter salmoneus]
MTSTDFADLDPAGPAEEERGLDGWRHSGRLLYALMGISAIACILASAVLSIDAYLLALNPDTVLGCDLNAAVSCGAVAQSWQAQVFGFPNAFIGLATEPVVLTIAVAGFSGVRFPRWFMLSAQIGYLLGLIFAYWLFYQSYTDIGALCPWCLTITVFTTVTFFTMLHINIAQDNLHLPRRAQKSALKAVRLGLDVVVPGVLIAAIAMAILVKYGTVIFS